MLFYPLVLWFLLATNETEYKNGLSCVSVGWNPILGSKDGE